MWACRRFVQGRSNAFLALSPAPSASVVCTTSFTDSCAKSTLYGVRNISNHTLATSYLNNCSASALSYSLRSTAHRTEQSSLGAPVRYKISIPSEKQYPFIDVESKWQRNWKDDKSTNANNHVAESATNSSHDLKPKPDYYCLSMFPYPSGNLHMGHVRVYTISDCLARYHKFKGYNVIHPMGWDAFGLPAENAAIQRGIAPKEWTLSNIKHMRTQMDALGLDFDWEREVTTCDPSYYKWTQWIFLQLFRRGFAYQKEAVVNWDPVDQTVLANEQVDAQGKSWRSGALVERRSLRQWFFAITKYADELNSSLESLSSGWPNLVRTMQKVWIGRKHSAHINFEVLLSQPSDAHQQLLTAFTTRPDTIFGVSYIALSNDHAFVDLLKSGSAGVLPKDLAEFVEASKQRQIERKLLQESQPVVVGGSSGAAHQKKAEDVPTEGIFTGLYATHPLIKDLKIPIYIADYVEPGRGTGVVMGVPAHDVSDYAFALKHGLDVKPVLRMQDPAGSKAGNTETESNLPLTSTSHVVLDNIPAPFQLEFEGLPVAEAQVKIVDLLESLNKGELKPTFAIHDWLVSRQRFWGTPIPIIHCAKCGAVPVPEKDLPVALPDNLELTGKGPSPLASDSPVAVEWRKCTCPKCGSSDAERETDTLDTFIDSSWYFLRYLSDAAHRASESTAYTPSSSSNEPRPATALPWNPEEVKRFFPVTQYIGGIEHAILHLLYSRFITRFLADDPALGLNNSPEPFAALLTQGMVHGEAFKHPVSKRYYRHDDVEVVVDPKTGERVGYSKPTSENEERIKLETVWEKMSKSKSNGVEPDAMVVKFGADVCRLFILFKAPPEKVLDWDERTVQGNFRWINRLWAIARAYESLKREGNPSAANQLREDLGWNQRSVIERPKNESGLDHYLFSPAELDLLQTTAETLENFTNGLDTHNFNVAIAHLMKFSNILEEYLEKTQVPSTDASSNGAPDWVYSKSKLGSRAFEEALEIFIRMLAPITPHFASEFWTLLMSSGGGGGGVRGASSPTQNLLSQSWPKADPTWLSIKTAPIIIQQSGKLKQCVDVPFELISGVLDEYPDDLAKAQDVLKEVLLSHELIMPHVSSKMMNESSNIICRLTKNNTAALINFVMKKTK